MIEWMELKNYLAPTFMKEIDTVSEIYMSTYSPFNINRPCEGNPRNKRL